MNVAAGFKFSAGMEGGHDNFKGRLFVLGMTVGWYAATIVGDPNTVTALVQFHGNGRGKAVDDFMRPDRVVIGTSSARAKKVMEQLYKPFLRQGNPIYFMDERSAELTKYAANAFLATKITFMNEVAGLCERTGADIDQVRIGIGSDSRIGKSRGCCWLLLLPLRRALDIFGKRLK